MSDPPVPSAWPAVSYVMPVLNEEHYLHQAITTVLSQDYPAERELILALGPSTDDTEKIARRHAAADPRIRIVHNPGTDIPIGLNRAISASEHPIVVRVDAHSELPTGYTRAAVAALLEHRAAGRDVVNIGGVMRARGTRPFQQAAARAYNSKLGLGASSYHAGGEPGPCESAYLGVFCKSAMTEVGGYDESIRRGEDWELNLRLREAGHLVWFDPRLEVAYHPRETPAKLARQFFSTGVWRAQLVRSQPGSTPLRFYAPPALVLSLVSSVLLIPLLATGVLHGWVGWVLGLVYLGPASYLVALIGLLVTTPGGRRPRLDFVAAVVIMHVCWGSGFCVGLARGAQGNRDTSRTGFSSRPS